MDAILSAGIDFILAVQALGTPATDRFFEVFTQLGGRGYLLLVPLALWCLDYRLGLRICLAMAATLFVNTVLKEWIGLDRPFVVDDRIVSEGERGFSMPSGHAQLVVVYWGLLAHHVRHRWLWVFAVTWMFGMGFSRVYLGVHYPTDVIVGWGIGALTAWPFAAHADRLDAFWRSAQIGRAAGIVGLVALVTWLFDATLVRDHTYMIPGIAGFVLGASLGGLLIERRGVFTGRGAAWQRVARIVLGLALLMPLMGTLQRLGVPAGDLGTRGVVALDLALFGFWLTGGSPGLFEMVRLARRPDAPSD